MSTFPGACTEVIAERGLFCSLYTDRAGALLAHAGGRRQGRQGQSDPGGPGLGSARDRADRGLFARGAGALGAYVRDPAEAPAAGAAPGRDHHHGRRQPLSQGGLLAGSQRGALPGPLRRPARPSWPLPAISPTSSRRPGGAPGRQRQHGALRRTASSRSRPTATATTTPRPRCACTNIPTASWPSSTDPGAWPATRPSTLIETQGRRPRDPLRRDRPPALWTSGQLGTADLTTSPQAQQQQQKRSIHMVHKPVNSVCYRQANDVVESGRRTRAYTKSR